MWALLVAAVTAAASDSTNTLQRAVSVSHQFIAYTPGRLLPHAVCVFAEQLRREWAQLLETGPAWRDPILIVLNPAAPSPNPPAVAVLVARSELGLKYRIDYRATPVDQQTLAAGLVEALCAEYANRAQPLAHGTPFTAAPSPPWLAHGLAQSILGRDESLMQAARLSLAGGQPQTAGSLLAATELPADPSERRLFRANAWLLAEGLLRQPRGAAKLRRYLVELGRQHSASNAFGTAYGEDFREAGALERWWAVELSDRLTTTSARQLPVPETSARLDEILTTRVEQVREGLATPVGASSLLSTRQQDARATSVVAFRDLWRFDEQPWLEQVLRMKLVGLADLLARSGPAYRPVIENYMAAVRLLADEKTGPFRRVVKQAEAARGRVEEQGRQIGDHLDQAERLFAPQEIGRTYSDFFRVFEEFDTLQQQRRSPISDYLDQFDR